MAISVVGATSAGSSAQVASLATTLPTGWAAGDLALMCAGIGNDTTGLAVTGWTELYDTANTGDSNGFDVGFYTRTLQAGDTAPSITSGGGKMSYAMLALHSDTGATLVVDVALNAKMDTATATSHTANALTAVSASVASILATVARNSATGATASTHTPPTNWTEPAGGDAGSSTGTTAANRQTSCSVAYRLGQSGTITPGAMTLSLTGYATLFHILIAEQAAAAPQGPTWPFVVGQAVSRSANW